ncbi:MAG: transcription-repair coupling factor [Alphaproteobacteria bacterium]|nr:transcription-repair coupling factor [Alphaproteobacteria bacterium]
MKFSENRGECLLAGVPDGYAAVVLADMAKQTGDVLHICRDDVRLASLAEQLAFFAPDVDVLQFPAWDTVPYDRVSPNTDIVAKRLETLSILHSGKARKARIVLTTVNAVLQRVPPVDFFKTSLSAEAGKSFDEQAFHKFLEKNGYQRTEQVMEAGEYAVRGGIIDVFAPGTPEPLRLDLFGDELETIRTFDPMTQRTTGQIDRFVFKPVSEIALDSEAIARFRTNYRESFGSGVNDALYESISEGRRFSGMEHWLPLFHDGTDTLFAFLPEAAVSADYQTQEAVSSRLEQIDEFFQARLDAEKNGLSEGGFIYHPVPKEQMFLDAKELNRLLAGRAVYRHFPFAAPEEKGNLETLDAGGRAGKDFSAERAVPDANVYDAVRHFIVEERQNKKQVVLTAFSTGSRARIASLLTENGLVVAEAGTWAEALKIKDGTPFVVLPLDEGFRTDRLTVVSEADILGDRLVRTVKRKKRGDQFIADVSALNEGDLVVHVDHGIGRYKGLETLQIGGASHDCVCLIYADDDKLFVPVENIETLSRYGSEQAGVLLDKLGGAAWQARKARLKKRIRDMAEALIKVAAERYLKKADKLPVSAGVYDDFCARFPYAETEDQEKSIQDVLRDLSEGRPMDRLICGDVGFGKTEVALRAAFTAAMNGVQVAVVVPTTLLARQHFETFSKRLTGFPLRVGQLSRLTGAKQAAAVKKELEEGSLDIVIGTHALLAKTISFKKLGLLIVDEEQHFGVAHKERLKQLRSNVHVLTLTATPIPRTLQMALTGVRELSIIATPPVDRLAVRTFVLPFDPVIIREALMREYLRGGQTFYVCPRISDMDEVMRKLKALVPEIRVVAAHGRMSPKELEDIMTAFADKKYDVLLSTTIIESGLDMPSVNTIVIHRADMFGLAQLYQLRGRVGRAKTRGYAYLTLPPRQKVTKTALKRMEVMQKLDTLGAGFTLASYDLDIRGAGNLLGEEQSGHIKEVGIELYQKMLEEAVAEARSGTAEQEEETSWSPQITAGMPVLIPENYVRDLGIRMGLYKRLADMTEINEIEAFAAEMTDRFGPLPPEVENLMEIIAIKTLCRRANVEKIEAGSKGAVVTLKNNRFPNPAGLVKFIAQNSGAAKLRPDQKIVYKRVWDIPKDRIRGMRKLMEKMAEIAEQSE